MKNYTEKEVESLIKLAVSTTISGMQKWLESDDVFIRDKDSKEILLNAELDAKAGALKEYVLPELTKSGFVFSSED